MTAEDLEREIRRSPTMNERFLLGLLDEVRAKLKEAWSDGYDKGKADLLESQEMES